MLFQVWRVCGSSFFALGAKCVAKSPIFGMKNWVRECWQTTMKCQIQWLGVRRADHWKLASDPNTSSTWTSKLPIEEQFLLTSDHMQLGASSVTYLATSLVMSKRDMTYPSWSSSMHWQERCKCYTISWWTSPVFQNRELWNQSRHGIQHELRLCEMKTVLH